MAKNPTKVTTGRARLSFPHLFELYAFQEGDTPKYSAMILIPKSDEATVAKIRAAEDAVYESANGSSIWGGKKIPRDKVVSVLKDGDEDAEDFPERADHWVMTPRSKYKPQVVDTNVDPIMDQSEIYSGVYGRVSLGAFAYKSGKDHGVSFALNNVQKLADGERLGGGSNASDDFDEVDEDDDLI